MDLNKYFASHHDAAEHGNIVGFQPDGFPVRGTAVPNLVGDQADELPLVGDFKCRTFCTWLPEDMAAYEVVMDRVANKQFYLQKELELPVPEQGGWRLFVTWVQVYAQAPSPGAGQYARY